MDLAHTPGSAYSFVSRNQVWYWTFTIGLLLTIA